MVTSSTVKKEINRRCVMDFLECLDRMLNEIDALEAIYASNDDSSIREDCRFIVLSTESLENARALLQQQSNTTACPELQIEIRLHTSFLDETKETRDMILRCRLPSGYPEIPAIITSTSVEGLNRSRNESLAAMLNEKSSSMAGQESVMELVEDFKRLASESITMNDSQSQDAMLDSQDRNSSETAESSFHSFGRRWIWVHHIKNADRKKAIIAEATELHLGGFLKSGYPGIIVIEGRTCDCDDFVTWVKGNKSRPGGFGRNWGHHVRGQLDFSFNDRKFMNDFKELEDMTVLGRECKERGVEIEFLEYVMQHRGST